MSEKQTATRTNLVLLYARIRELGYSIKEVASYAGIKPQTMYNKLNGRGRFTVEEIVKLRRVLELDDEATCQIFMHEYVSAHEAV